MSVYVAALDEAGRALARIVARDLRHGRDVALKVLRPEISAEIGAERLKALPGTTLCVKCKKL